MLKNQQMGLTVDQTQQKRESVSPKMYLKKLPGMQHRKKKW